jgi:hypothetical protein
LEKIGNKEIVYRGSFLVPEGENVSFDADVSGWKVNVIVEFQDSGGEQGLQIEPTDSGAKIVLLNWNSSIGTALVSPANLGAHSSGKKLSFMVSNYRVGKTNKLDIQLLLEGNS